MILRMDEFDTDYSFLNLPEAGSDVRGPIGLPIISPLRFNLFGGGRPIQRPRPEPIAIEPIRRIGVGNDQGRFEMGRAIGQEVNMLRENIQTLEAAKGELASERDAAIQMQDQIRQQMSEQRIQELNQQQAQLQAELQEAVAAAEDRGIDAVAEAEAQAAEELASVSADFQSQIDSLTGERDQAIAEQDMIRAEAADQQAQALEMQKQDYEAQLAALQQPAAETPEIPDIGPVPGMEEQFPYLDLLSQEPSQEAKDAFARSMETGEPVISPDQVQEMINSMSGSEGQGGLPEGYSYDRPMDGMYTSVMPSPGMRYAYGPDGDRIEVPDNRPPIDQRRPMPPPPLPPSMLPPKRDDQLFISDGPIIDEGQIMPAAPLPLPRPVSGGGTYKEFPDGQGGFLSVGVRPPTFSTNPDRKIKGGLLSKMKGHLTSGGITGQLPIAPVSPAINPLTRSIGSVGGMGSLGGRSRKIMTR